MYLVVTPGASLYVKRFILLDLHAQLGEFVRLDMQADRILVRGYFGDQVGPAAGALEQGYNLVPGPSRRGLEGGLPPHRV